MGLRPHAAGPASYPHPQPPRLLHSTPPQPSSTAHALNRAQSRSPVPHRPFAAVPLTAAVRIRAIQATDEPKVEPTTSEAAGLFAATLVVATAVSIRHSEAVGPCRATASVPRHAGRVDAFKPLVNGRGYSAEKA